jgi:hypothetical protein
MNSPDVIELLKKQLLIIGESQTDLYTGNITPLQIADSITVQLKDLNVFEINRYKEWLSDSNSDYQTLTIEDGSCWTLRFGENEDRYIHIHPCRNTLHTIRVKASNLKTAVAVLVWTNPHNNQSPNLSTVNKIRKEILSECPVKSLEISTGLNTIIMLLNGRKVWGIGV